MPRLPSRPLAPAQPVGCFNFRVSIGNGKLAVEIGFTRVEFPSFAVPDANPSATRPPDESSAERPLLVLRRGWDGTPALADWWDQSRKSPRAKPRAVSIELLDAAGAEATLRWSFSGCRPVALHHSALDAQQSGVLFESLSLVFDTVELSR